MAEDPASGLTQTALIEAQAEALLATIPEWIWDRETLPVPVEAIADTHFGLLVRDVEDMTAAPNCPPLSDGQSLSGLLLAHAGEIWVNGGEAREWPPRRRFTIAHELGHWVLHRDQQTQLFCRHGAVDPPTSAEQDSRPPLDAIEAEANAFAAALLMPAALIEHHYAATGKSHAKLCELFGASGAAMGKRLNG